MTTCICNDDTLEKTLICYQCKATWNLKLEYHERMSKCVLHKKGIQICGDGCGPSLCNQCKTDGYILQADRTENPWFPKWTVIKNNGIT